MLKRDDQNDQKQLLNTEANNKKESKIGPAVKGWQNLYPVVDEISSPNSPALIPHPEYPRKRRKRSDCSTNDSPEIDESSNNDQRRKRPHLQIFDDSLRKNTIDEATFEASENANTPSAPHNTLNFPHKTSLRSPNRSFSEQGCEMGHSMNLTMNSRPIQNDENDAIIADSASFAPFNDQNEYAEINRLLAILHHERCRRQT